MIAAGIFYASVLAVPSGNTLAPTGPFGALGVDKYLHLAGYAVLAAALARALGRGSRSKRRTAGVAVLGAVLLGVGVELCQLPVAGRAAAPADALANAAGAAIGAVGWPVLVRILGGSTADEPRA